MTSVDWRGVMGCWLTVVVSAFLVILVLEEGAQLSYWFMDIPDRRLGADLWEEHDDFFRGGFRWDLRWQLFQFLDMRFFKQDALLTIAEAFGVYALAKRLRIRGNQKKSQ